MKRAPAPWTLNVGCSLLVLSCFSVASVPAFALTAENPYGGIVERNAFALKPPTLPAVVAPPVAPPSNVELRGITTLLGRPQVLLNFKLPGKPPEPPKDRSLVMDVGQREGEVEVLEINPASGTVRIRNQGNESALNLKDNVPKPQFTASAAVPGMPLSPGVAPALPSPGGVPAPAPANPNPGTMGGSTAPAAPAPRPALPSRNLRAGGGGAEPVAGGFADPVQQAAAIEIMAEKNKALIDAGKMPPPPFTGVK